MSVPEIRGRLAMPFASLIAIIALSIQPSLAQAVKQSECVGRYEFDLPGDVDVAMLNFDLLAESVVKKFGYRRNGRGYAFPSDAEPRWSGTWGSDQQINDVLLSGPLMDRETFFGRFKQAVDKSWHGKQEELNAFHRKDQADELRPTTTDLPDAFAWTWAKSITVYMLRGGRAFTFTGDTSDPSDVDSIQYVSEYLHSRALYEIPTESGICLHYGFLPDGRQHPKGYNIAVTYRLKDHPDVEIFFEDSYAANDLKGNSPEEEVNSFWGGGFHGPQKRADKQRRILNAHIPGVVQFPSVKMGGYDGKASFVEMDHADGGLDYGYMAYVKGHAEANGYARTIMLYVIRTAARAKGVPVSKGELKAMAEGIVASVRLHPVRP